MAKTGFPFYRAETDRFQDIKIKRLKKRYHGNGYAVYQYILNEIYRVEGCFLDFGEDEVFDVAEYWGLEEAEVQAIATFCCEIGLFDMEMYDAYRILTARSIQSRYTEMCKLSKRKATIPENYLLLIPEETTTPETTAAQNAPINVPTPEHISTQNAPTSATVSTPNAPTSENPPRVSAKNTPTNQADIPVISPEISRKTPKIPETSGKNGIFLEKTPKTPENFNRVEKSREEYPPTYPPGREGGGNSSFPPESNAATEGQRSQKPSQTIHRRPSQSESNRPRRGRRARIFPEYARLALPAGAIQAYA